MHLPGKFQAVQFFQGYGFFHHHPKGSVLYATGYSPARKMSIFLTNNQKLLHIMRLHEKQTNDTKNTLIKSHDSKNALYSIVIRLWSSKAFIFSCNYFTISEKAASDLGEEHKEQQNIKNNTMQYIFNKGKKNQRFLCAHIGSHKRHLGELVYFLYHMI